jgi:hypothetical protein
MGEVWKARDTKLNRIVALKILPEVFSLDPDRLARRTMRRRISARTPGRPGRRCE